MSELYKRRFVFNSHGTFSEKYIFIILYGVSKVSFSCLIPIFQLKGIYWPEPNTKTGLGFEDSQTKLNLSAWIHVNGKI